MRRSFPSEHTRGMRDRPIRLIVVDDDARVRAAIARTIMLEADLVLVGVARDAAGALAMAAACDPDGGPARRASSRRGERSGSDSRACPQPEMRGGGDQRARRSASCGPDRRRGRVRREGRCRRPADAGPQRPPQRPRTSLRLGTAGHLTQRKSGRQTDVQHPASAHTHWCSANPRCTGVSTMDSAVIIDAVLLATVLQADLGDLIARSPGCGSSARC